MKLRNKILSYTLPLILIPFLLTALAVYYFVIRANQIEIQEERNQRLNVVLVGFGEEITSTRKDVALISNVPAVEDFLQSIKSDLSSYNVKNQEVKVRKILEIFFEQNTYYLELTLVDGKGMERITISKLSKQLDSRRLSNEEYFRRALIEDSFQSPVREIHPQVFATIFAIYLVSSFTVVSALSISSSVVSVSDNEAIIEVITDETSTVRLQYSEDRITYIEETDLAFNTARNITLSSLTSETQYYYKIQAQNASGFQLEDNNSNAWYTLNSLRSALCRLSLTLNTQHLSGTSTD